MLQRPFTLSSLAQAMALVATCAVVAACAPLYPVSEVQFPIATAPEMPASGPAPWAAMQPVAQGDAAANSRGANGAIFQAASYRPLFEDNRARMVGDTLTIQITEQLSATQTATSTLDKKGGINGSVSAVPFISGNAFARGSVAANNENKFEGSGTTGSSNGFTGTITAIVTGVLPNGHLLVAGEKQIGLNHNVDTLRFTGQVDPRSIQPGNTILSTKVANVRVAHRGAGAMADTQGIGWLGRFFLNLSPV
jgi:flagellar L-ring protein precursor FlgH